MNGFACPLCDHDQSVPFFDLPNVPCHIGILWPNPATATSCPRGDLHLSVCPRCGFIWNRDFDPARVEYSAAYDNTLHFSPHYQRYAEDIARGLVDRHDLHGKLLVEIGSGKGEFLSLLCQLGDNRGVGFDPSYDGRHDDPGGRVRFVREFYSIDHGGLEADLILSRYVFEHVPHPRSFLSVVLDSMHGKPSVVYFEVPNALLFLRDGSPWDIIYEHCSYFSPTSLARAFELSGFTVSRVREQYDGQMIGIEATPGPTKTETGANPNEVREIVAMAERFGAGFREQVSRWREWEAELAAAGARAAIWGAGAKAVSFLNLLSSDAPIHSVVDVNPAKHGKFVPGSGQPITAPETLRDSPPEMVVVMNPVYEEEIRAHLTKLGLAPEVRCAF